MTITSNNHLPKAVGLYDPRQEKDSCGVGFVAHIKGERSHQIIEDSDHLACRMDHRGARGSEKNTGDGAGILTALPHEFLQRVAKEDLHVELPVPGRFAAGNVFLPTNEAERELCKQTVAEICAAEGQELLGWRDVPVDADAAGIGPTARSAAPKIEQLFISATTGLQGDAFERVLYLIRKLATRKLRTEMNLKQAEMFYVCSLSTKVIIYKGMLTPAQVRLFYPDLKCEDYTSHLAMVHSRFSTNTFPSWDRAQPNRFMSHNGEINTLRGNMNWMSAREGVAKCELFGDKLQDVFPVIDPDVSDSGAFDNVLEFLLMTGRTLQSAVMMMVPEAWQKNDQMSAEKKAFYEFHSAMMEPWDGPASIAFTDGRYIGAVLDRNGLRPSRYYLTHDDRVIMASEVGVVPVDPSNVKAKGRLEPGKMFLVDFEKGALIPDEELKNEFATSRPYAQWIEEQRMYAKELDTSGGKGLDADTLLERMQAFGYTTETMQFMLRPLITELRDPVGSMGNDSALAVLSDKPRMVYDYFKQLFAQVTNPPIDSIREEIIMSLECYIGPETNLLTLTEKNCHRLRLRHPILSNPYLDAIKNLDERGWKTKTIDTTYPRTPEIGGLTATLERICAEAEQAIDDGYSFIILSDRKMGKERIAVSALLATGAVHHYLIKQAKRTRIGIIVESGEAREVHHHCMLVGYGADAINPYLAFESLWQARLDGQLNAADFPDDDSIVAAYRKAAAKGMLKVMARMGISTLQSYKGAQIFEGVGIASEVIDVCFAGTASRLEGVGFDVLELEALRRHKLGYPDEVEDKLTDLPNPGDFHWRSAGERHAWNPNTIAALQLASRQNDHNAYDRFAAEINADARTNCTLRGLLELKPGAAGEPIPLEEVEPASEIVKRFVTGAMSYGSISRESHESLAIAMNRLGGKSNTGEGGEDPERFNLMPSGDSKRSAIKQVASGRFGVTAWYLTNADELQIKMAQGAKPGEGGELPGQKVDEIIARIRYSTPGVGLISPPPHHDIYSIEDLAQLIHDLKNANPSARISVKLVSEVGVGTIAAGVAKAHADHILISGDSGGTGASPLTSIKHAGLPWELGIAEAHQTLVMNDLRSRVVVQTDGGLKTGRDVVIAAILGAEEMGFSTAPLISLGCIMMRKCHLNTCPVGIATQNPVLRKKFAGEPEHVVNYLFMVAEEARKLMAELGIQRFVDMIGRTDLLDTTDAIDHWKSDGLDLSKMLTPAQKPHANVDVYCTSEQDHSLQLALDNRLIEKARYALKTGEKVNIEMPILNTNRAVGTMLSHELVKKHGENGLPVDTIHIKLNGSAGQSFGAWLARGITLELEGDSNDYVGKGLSGGRIIVYPPKESTFVAEDNVIVGNVLLYGATGGRAFLRGLAAERFCVRNSGARAVVEGVGDHGCEYMTGGRAVILGPTGLNFAAGMSGGVAYIYDPKGEFPAKCNMGTVDLDPVEDDEDISELRQMIEMHFEYTGSTVADQILDDWPEVLDDFVKVMPIDYKRVLGERRRHDEEIEAAVRDEDQTGEFIAIKPAEETN